VVQAFWSLTVGKSGVEWGAVGQGAMPHRGGEVGPVFLGTHSPRLDDKGRLFLPAKYREELSGGLVITKGQERCLYVFPEAEFQRITDALRTAPVTAKAVRDYSRVFFASASDEVPDKQGRITIPPALRNYAGLSRDCAVIGANTRLEIWDATAWETYLADQEPQFSDLSEEVLPGVL
jgi:MraZ protein